MILRLVLAGGAFAVAAAFSTGHARAATAAENGSQPVATRSNAEEIQIARRRRHRRHRVRTRRTAPEATATPAGKATSNGEVLFGVQDVGFLVDRDYIRVGPEIGKFDRVRLRVLKNDIYITDLKAVYENGDFETLLTDAKINANRKTDWIPLNRDAFIKEFQLVYRSRPDFKGRARVEVFGEYKDGWLGPNGEGRKYNDGWVLLGTDTAGSIGFDRVKIPVGKNEGGFKKLRVSVKDRDITMTNLTVVYEDGAKDDIETNRIKVAADKAFGPVDLKKDATIKEILATWRSRALATSKRTRAYATVQVWARH
jgi:hypothetical protein